MRSRFTRLVCAALAVALPFALVAPAGAAEFMGVPVKEKGPRKASSASGQVAGGPMVAANIPGDSLSASPVNATILGTEFDHVYSVDLAPGQVLHAVLTFDVSSGEDLDMYGFTPDTTDVTLDPYDAFSGSALGIEEFYLAADGTATDTYYLDIYNFGEMDTPYTLTWEVISRSPATVTRLGGNTRYDVAENAANAAFGDYAKITDIIIASGADGAVADPLCAAGLAGAYNAPLMLVQPTLINGHTNTQTERVIEKIKTANGGGVNIHVVGGTAWIPNAVYNRLYSLKGTGTCERITGSDRYSLSLNMARRADAVLRANGDPDGVPFVMIAAGDNSAAFYDALAASPISYYNVAPTILARKTGLSSPAISALGATGTFKDQPSWLISNSNYLSNTVGAQAGAVGRIVGSSAGTNRYTAAGHIANFAQGWWLLDNVNAGVANKLPDALTGGVALGNMGAPLLYTGATTLEQDNTGTYLYFKRGGLDSVYILGGTGSVSNTVATDIGDWTFFPWP